MKAKAIRLPKTRLLAARLLLFSLFFIHQSCTKLDTCNAGFKQDPTEKFFIVPAGTSPQVLRIIDNLKAQNAKTGFIMKLATTEGFAVWNKVISSVKQVINRNATGDPDTLIYIPLVLENTRHVNSVIVARLNGNMMLKLYRGNQYQNFGFGQTNGESAQSVATTLAVLDYKVFGITDFKVNDHRLFADSASFGIRPGSEKNTLHISGNIEGNSSATSRPGDVWVTICVEHEGWVPTQGLAAVFWAYKTWQECETTVYSFLIDDSGPEPIEPPLGQPGGGSGGSPTGPITPGNPTCTIIFNGEMPQPCGPTDPQGPITVLDGGEPITDPDTYNPNQADNVILDTSISNNFPCVGKILDTLSAYGTDNLNKKAQVALKIIFGESTYQHITIKSDPTLSPDRDAETDPGTHYTVGTDITPHYNFTIRVNPAMLATATKEYIAATLVHEAMHAYINYLFYEYQFGLIDSNAIKNKFPIFWYHTPPYYLGTNAIYQHNLIANNWAHEIQNSLNIFTNNEMTQAQKDNVYRALSWAGLEKDSYSYQTLTLPDKFNIAAINAAARNRFHTGPYTITLLTGEVSPVYNFTASSLKLKNPCD